MNYETDADGKPLKGTPEYEQWVAESYEAVKDHDREDLESLRKGTHDKILQAAIDQKLEEIELMNGLESSQILELLKEASKNDISSERLAQISTTLEKAVFSGNMDEQAKGKTNGFRMVVSDLFFKTTESRPEKLVSLLPIFIMLCGKKDGKTIISDINWDELDKL